MVKHVLALIALVALSCTNASRSDEPFPVSSSSEQIIYEGRIPLTDRDFLYLELSMYPGTSGEGSYMLSESLETERGIDTAVTFQGNYSSFVVDSAINIHLENSAYSEGFKREYMSPDGKRIREEKYRITDLVLRKEGEHKLIALDRANKPLTSEYEFNLSKRTSNIFTIEGQFIYLGNGSVFFETNTAQSWPVSKQGMYHLAAQQYHQLATAKNEGIYLKGIGFSIREEHKPGAFRDALVIKKLITMASTPTSN